MFKSLRSLFTNNASASASVSSSVTSVSPSPSTSSSDVSSSTSIPVENAPKATEVLLPSARSIFLKQEDFGKNLLTVVAYYTGSKESSLMQLEMAIVWPNHSLNGDDAKEYVLSEADGFPVRVSFSSNTYENGGQG